MSGIIAGTNSKIYVKIIKKKVAALTLVWACVHGITENRSPKRILESDLEVRVLNATYRLLYQTFRSS